jgi:molybdenum cofactor biosynthesis protein B
MQEHRRDQSVKAVAGLVITSDTRTPETDETGRAALKLLQEAGHTVAAYVMIGNEVGKIKEALEGLLLDKRIQVIITSGGTGIGPRDKTVDAVSSLLERRIEGFGELFRRLSYDEIGVASMMSRATAGITKGKIVFCLPGSRGATEMALKEIILPSLGHMLWELGRE